MQIKLTEPLESAILKNLYYLRLEKEKVNCLYLQTLSI